MLEMNNIVIVQNGNQYRFFTETNICLGAVALPPNGQYAYDAKALAVITKALAARWGIIKPKQGK